jgi:phage repressor protein C with HTH and peptisase S24 domain
MESDDIRTTLDRLIAEAGTDYSTLSRLLGRNAAYVQQFVKRGTPRRLAEDDRARLAAYFGVPESVLGGRTERVAVRGAAPQRAAMAFVPRLAIGASAGAGAAVDAEASDAGFGFDPRWLRKLGADPRALSIIRVEGDSMAPTLSDGDDILVDAQDTAARLRDGIYVLRLDDLLMVKRVARAPGKGRIAVTSDNPHYPSYPDLAADAVALVGRVIWTGRKIG